MLSQCSTMVVATGLWICLRHNLHVSQCIQREPAGLYTGHGINCVNVRVWRSFRHADLPLQPSKQNKNGHERTPLPVAWPLQRPSATPGRGTRPQQEATRGVRCRQNTFQGNLWRPILFPTLVFFIFFFLFICIFYLKHDFFLFLP